VFFKGERHDLSKTGGFGPKMPPPPGKPVTFYECHPENHAPVPSVRADFFENKLFIAYCYLFFNHIFKLFHYNYIPLYISKYIYTYLYYIYFHKIKI